MMRKIERMVHDFIAQSKEALRDDRKLHEKTLKHAVMNTLVRAATAVVPRARRKS